MANYRPDDLQKGADYLAGQQQEENARTVPLAEIQAANVLTATEVNSDGDPRERVALEAFQSSPLLVIEDDKRNIGRIQEALKNVGKTDAVFADSLPGAKRQITEMLKDKKGAERIRVISDLQIFYEEGDEIAEEEAGIQAIGEVQKAVAEWNKMHPSDKPIQLEILINSSMLNSAQDLENFKKKNSKNFVSPETIIGGNHGRKEESVSTFLAYLKNQDVHKDGE